MIVVSFDLGIKNFSYCQIEYNSVVAGEDPDIPGVFRSNILDWGVQDLGVSDPSDATIQLVRFLDSKPGFLKSDIVIIEKQPSFNPKMRTLSHSVQTYFVIRGIVDRELTGSTISKVMFFSPKHKLKAYDGPSIVVQASSVYQRTKKLGVAYCRSMIRQDRERTSFFEGHKKKDDLADSYLQAVYYIKTSFAGSGIDPTVEPPPLKKVSAREPTEAQRKRKKWSGPNLKFIFQKVLEQARKELSLDPARVSGETFLKEWIKTRADILSAIRKNYPWEPDPVQTCLVHLIPDESLKTEQYSIWTAKGLKIAF